MALPKPIGHQKDVLYLPAKGHFVVLGTAGSGKTTLAILRSAYLADPKTAHGGPTLLLTFNRALVTYLHHLKERTLRNVTIENYHTFARGYLASRGKMPFNCICSADQRLVHIRSAAGATGSANGVDLLAEHPLSVYSEEIKWIAQHGFRSAALYIKAVRAGAATPRLSRELRATTFDLYEAYKTIRAKASKLYDWDDLATAVSEEFDSDAGERLYRHVVIDEGQDFSPEMIRSLAKAIPPDGSLTFFGDVAQQIYGRRMSWRSAGLNISKVWKFEKNYRNSRQIAALGLAISKMPYFPGDPDMVEPDPPTADGPLPTLVECGTRAKEIDLVVDQAIRSSKTLSVAILTRGRSWDSLLSKRLPKQSVRLHRDMTTWQAGPGIRYGTYFSAKGLEFDMVLLPFCDSTTLPDPELVKDFGLEEAAARDGQQLYVAVTRAKTRLVITYNGAVSELLPPDSGLYTKVKN